MCDICKSSFTQKSSLKSHLLRFHSGNNEEMIHGKEFRTDNQSNDNLRKFPDDNSVTNCEVDGIQDEEVSIDQGLNQCFKSYLEYNS
jgi:hypothetical protein